MMGQAAGVSGMPEGFHKAGQDNGWAETGRTWGAVWVDRYLPPT